MCCVNGRYEDPAEVDPNPEKKPDKNPGPDLTLEKNRSGSNNLVNFKEEIELKAGLRIRVTLTRIRPSRKNRKRIQPSQKPHPDPILWSKD